jgi:hypothetical protein
VRRVRTEELGYAGLPVSRFPLRATNGLEARLKIVKHLVPMQIAWLDVRANQTSALGFLATQITPAKRTVAHHVREHNRGELALFLRFGSHHRIRLRRSGKIFIMIHLTRNPGFGNPGAIIGVRLVCFGVADRDWVRMQAEAICERYSS